MFDTGWGTRVSDGDEYWSSDADKRCEGVETSMSSVWRYSYNVHGAILCFRCMKSIYQPDTYFSNFSSQ